jgi:hypothetical protein
VRSCSHDLYATLLFVFWHNVLPWLVRRAQDLRFFVCNPRYRITPQKRRDK